MKNRICALAKLSVLVGCILYNTPVIHAQTGPNPIAYWAFDEGSGTMVEDSSGNGNTQNQ